MRWFPKSEQDTSKSPAVSSLVNSPRGFGRTFQALNYQAFLFLWMGEIGHAFGLWIWMIALPLLVLDLTNSAVHLGAVMAVRTIPAMAFGMVAGLVADTFNRKVVLLGAKVGAVIVGGVFAILVLGDWIELWHVYVLSLFRGMVMAFDQPARRAIVPSILPENLVTNALALSMGSIQVTRIAGAAGAGIMVATLGMGATFLTSAIMYVFAFIFTALVKVPDYERSGYQGPRRMLDDFRAGFHFAWTTPAVRAILIVALAYFTFGASFMQVFAPLLAKGVLNIGDAGFGYMMAMTGVGGMFGALVLATINPSERRGTLLIGAILAFGVVLVLFSLATYTMVIPLVFFLVSLLGVGQSVVFPLVNGVLLNAAPLGMRGRVMGLLTLDRAMISFGSMIAGFMAASMGAQLAQISFGIACIVAALLMWTLVPPLRRVD
jgi:MFS family permease